MPIIQDMLYNTLLTNSVDAFGGTQSSLTGLSVTPRILMRGTVKKIYDVYIQLSIVQLL